MKYFILCAFCITQLIAQNQITTVFIVRHAEKMTDSKNPSLTESGKQRADQIKYLLKDAGIEAIYSSDFKRTRETAVPLAKQLNLQVHTYSVRDNQSLVANVMSQYSGKTVLIVGHSNTVNKLSAAFGGDDFGELDESIYNFLFMLSVQSVDGKLIAKRTTFNTLNQKL